MQPLYFFAFNLLQIQMTGRYSNSRCDLNDCNIFSGEFWLTAILYSWQGRLTPIIIAKWYFSVFSFVAFIYIFSSEFWLTDIIYMVNGDSPAVLSFGAIWMTATFSAVTVFWPPYFIAVNGDLPLYMSRHNLTARLLFSDMFWLTAILNSGKFCEQFKIDD